MAEIITNILITILNREIIPTFKKFTFHPSSHKLDQNGFRRPEEKENAIHQHKKWSYSVKSSYTYTLIKFSMGWEGVSEFLLPSGSQSFPWRQLTISSLLVHDVGHFLYF